CFVHAVLDGKPLNFERRRYGSTTYTWVYVYHAGQWRQLYDPWPCITPKVAEVRETMRQVLAALDGEQSCNTPPSSASTTGSGPSDCGTALPSPPARSRPAASIS